jgi:hypothetical protein
MIRKVIALSKDKIEGERNVLCLFEELPRRLEILFGKFGMEDFSDQNSVGSDLHSQFADWAIGRATALLCPPAATRDQTPGGARLPLS